MASASTYLSKTFSTGDNRKKWTWSAWIKRSNLGSDNWLFHAWVNSSNENSIFFDSSDRLAFSIFEGGTNNNGRLTTTRKFRDTNAWYHIQCVWDSANATATDRMIIYVNGERETAFDTQTNATLNYDSLINSNNVHYIGQYGSGSSSMRFSGSMTHVNFIDGTAYAASAFGETDATTGIWKPKTAPSVTYGTNGFFLKFENSGSMGTDSSGNANNFTVNGTLTQTVDTPSNVFATLNPLQKYGGSLSNGNLTYVGTQDPDWIVATLAASAGKYYWEAQVNSGSSFILLGVTTTDTASAKQSASIGNDFIGFRNGDSFYNFGTLVTSSYSYADSDIFGFMLDLTAGECKFYQNDTLKQTITLPTDKGDTWIPVVGDTFDVTDGNYDLNFGNGYFGTTAVSSANSDPNGLGIFEYDTKTGYALCTKNINAQEYS